MWRYPPFLTRQIAQIALFGPKCDYIVWTAGLSATRVEHTFVEHCWVCRIGVLWSGLLQLPHRKWRFRSLPVGHFWCFWPIFAKYQCEGVVLPHPIWRTILLSNPWRLRRQVYDRIWTGFCQKNAFFISTTQKAQFCLCQLRLHFWKWPAQGATPGQNFHGTNHLTRLPRFQVPGVSGSKVILLGKKTKISQFFSSPWGSKKLRFVHTTKLASECMWKAHNLAGKMRRSAFH